MPRADQSAGFIRAAQPADAWDVRELAQRAYRPYVQRMGRRPAPMDDDYQQKVGEGLVFVADQDGIVGLIVMIKRRSDVLIENVAVDPPCQGEGIGRALLAFAEVSARARGIKTLRLYANAAMSENLAFYPRLGYEEVGRRTEDGFARVFFVKRL